MLQFVFEAAPSVTRERWKSSKHSNKRRSEHTNAHTHRHRHKNKQLPYFPSEPRLRLIQSGRQNKDAAVSVLDCLPPSSRWDGRGVGAKHMLLTWSRSEWSRSGGPGLPCRGLIPRLRPRLTLAVEWERGMRSCVRSRHETGCSSARLLHHLTGARLSEGRKAQWGPDWQNGTFKLFFFFF